MLATFNAWRHDGDERGRALAAAGVVLVHLLLGYALLAGLSVSLPQRIAEGLKMFDVAPPPPPPRERIEPRPTHAARREGAASPPNLRAKATEVVAPPPVLIVPPPPVLAASKVDVGAASHSGAAEVAGPGTGSGGQGNGTGNGRAGNGNGGGGTPLRWISGRIKDSDYPIHAFEAGIGGTVHLRFTVGVKGRVTDCTVTGSSGNADLDAATCRLIKQRLRYRPTTNAAGRPIPDTVEGEHVWSLYGPGDPRAPRDDGDEGVPSAG